MRRLFNSNKPSGLSHPYQLGESTFISGASGVLFFFFIFISFFNDIHVSNSFLFLFFNDIPVSKLYSPR